MVLYRNSDAVFFVPHAAIPYLIMPRLYHITGVVLYRKSDAVISYRMMLYHTACCYIITGACFIGSAAYGSIGRYIVYGHIYFADIYLFPCEVSCLLEELL